MQLYFQSFFNGKKLSKAQEVSKEIVDTYNIVK